MSNLKSFTDIRTWSAMFIFILMVLHNTAESLILRNTEADQKGNSLLLNHPNEPKDWEHRKEDNAYFPVVDNGLFEIQSRVAFSVDEPTLPPSVGVKIRTKRAVSEYKIKNIHKKKRRQRKLRKNKRKNRKQNKKRRHNHGIKKSRRRRSSRTGHSEQYDHEPLSVCDSVSDWVQLNESITQYDLPVQVLSHRWSGGQRLKQYIYETKCADSGQSCRGIDTENFRSECVTKKIYIDAFVRDEHGDEMWAKIEVNGACNCRLFRKRLGNSMSIFDFLGQHR